MERSFYEIFRNAFASICRQGVHENFFMCYFGPEACLRGLLVKFDMSFTLAFKFLKIRDKTEFENLAELFVREVIKKECWDNMKVKGRGIQVKH